MKKITIKAIERYNSTDLIKNNEKIKNVSYFAEHNSPVDSTPAKLVFDVDDDYTEDELLDLLATHAPEKTDGDDVNDFVFEKQKRRSPILLDMLEQQERRIEALEANAGLVKPAPDTKPTPTPPNREDIEVIQPPAPPVIEEPEIEIAGPGESL